MQKSNVLISVIIVNYNAGDLLVKAVRSVIDYPDVEVIVSDNASSDGSFVKLRKAIRKPNLILIDNAKNLGFGKAVNSAVQKSHGQYVYLLNPDASLSKNALLRMVETARSYRDRAIVAPRLENPDGSAQPSCYPRQTIWNAMREYWFGIQGAYSKYLPAGKKPIQVHAAVAAAWLVPRAVWDELGGLSDKYFLYFEDIDMCDRAHACGIAVIYDPVARVQHYHGVSSKTNPLAHNLFVTSAYTYHGRIKKYAIDVVILLRNLVYGQFSWKKVIGLSLVRAAIVVAIAAVGYFFLPERYLHFVYLPDIYKNNFLLWSWANFDGEHYLRIAHDGYHTFMGQSEHAFFPFYPLMIKLVSLTGLDLYLSAHVMTSLSALAAMGMVGLWARRHTKNPMGIVGALIMAPGAVYLSALYTEPLFIALAAGVFYFADQGKWSRAIALTVLATATRVTGIFVVIFLVTAMLRAGKSVVRAVGSGIIALSGLWSYMVFLYTKTGNPLAWYHAQSGWQKSDPTYPWVTFNRYWTAITTGWVNDLTHYVVVIEILVTVAALILVYKFWRTKSIDLAYKLYVAGCLALPLVTGSLGSMPRFILTLFPVYLVVQQMGRAARLIIYGVSLILGIIGIILFTRGYWYA